MSSGRQRSLAERLVRGWVRIYTWGLPAAVAEARRAEIDSDIWEQLHNATSEERPVSGFEMLGRFVRGIPADLTWRIERASTTRSPAQRIALPVVVVLSYGWLVFAWMSGWLGELLVWWFLLLPVLLMAPILAPYGRRCSGRLARAGLVMVVGGGITVGLALALLPMLIYLFDPMRLVWIGLLVLVGGFATLVGFLAFGVANLYERALPRGNGLPLVVGIFPFAAALPQSVLLIFDRRPTHGVVMIWSGVNLLAVLGFVGAYSALMYVIWRDTFGESGPDEKASQAISGRIGAR